MINIYDFLSTREAAYKILSFKDHLFVHYQCPQIEKYAKTYLHLHAIVYVIQGEKIYHHTGQSYSLNESNCYFIKKGALQQEKIHANDWIVMAFFIPDNYLKQFLNEYRSSLTIKIRNGIPYEKVIPLHMKDIVKGVFTSMMDYFMQSPRPSEQLVELKYRELIFNLLSDPANESLLSYISELSDSSRIPLEEVMENNYMYNLTLTEFARIAQRSLATFNREFISRYKKTPGKWLTEKRLDYARLLLETSKKSINEIADESGFENPSHFSRAFKVKFGLAPRSFRTDMEAIC